jgi:hypothetical protein
LEPIERSRTELVSSREWRTVVTFMKKTTGGLELELYNTHELQSLYRWEGSQSDDEN